MRQWEVGVALFVTFVTTAAAVEYKLVPMDQLEYERQKQSRSKLGQELAGYKPVPYKNADYFVVTKHVVWEVAKKLCEQNGAVLTSVMTQEEMKFLQNLTYAFNVTNYWIGGRRRYLNTDIKEFFWLENNKTVENWFWSTRADGCEHDANNSPREANLARGGMRQKPSPFFCVYFLSSAQVKVVINLPLIGEIRCPEPNNVSKDKGNEDCTEFNDRERKGNDYPCKVVEQAFICKRTCVDKTDYEDYAAVNLASTLFICPLQYFLSYFVTT